MNIIFFFSINKILITIKMSLVICSNNFKDGSIARQENSIENAFSFRNALSSTYSIPKNSQVALQSAKLNINGKVVFSRNTGKFFQYFGKRLDMDGETEPQIDDTTSHPLLVQLNDTDQIEEQSPSDFANTLATRLNETIYHPNIKNQIDVEILNNASSLDFKGYKIIYDQVGTVDSNIPTQNFNTWYRNDVVNASSPDFTYTGGVFTRNASLDEVDVCAGINTQYPLNLAGGEMVVNISHASADVNASGKETPWAVGLSRFVNNPDEEGFINPNYFSRYNNDDLGLNGNEVFMDFAVSRNSASQLVVFQSVWDSTNYELKLEEVDYWNNASSAFSGNGEPLDMEGTLYTKVKFEAEGESLRLEIFNASAPPGLKAAAAGSWETVTTYKAGEPKSSMFTPINQAQWCLHPVFWVGYNASNTSGSLEFDEYQGVNIAGYDPTKENKGGWFETMELLGKSSLCESVESRVFNQTDVGTAYEQDQLNASGGVNGSHILILQQSDIYAPSQGANATEVLGFNRGVVDTPVSETGSEVIFESIDAPSLINNLSLFVRLNNLGQNVMNAFTGNRSKIISHLTKLETQVGIVSYEPNNLVWLDLDNPADINLTDFDLSINYINEQYARIVTGDSIICLYFRKKPM
jgi:hypothetical protein